MKERDLRSYRFSSALSTNQEWNILLNSYKNQDIVKRVEKEFEEQWNNSFELTPEWIDEYEKTYQPIKTKSSEEYKLKVSQSLWKIRIREKTEIKP